MKKAALGMVSTGVILGAGASMTSGASAVGIGNMAAAMPTMGSVLGASESIKLLKGMTKKR